jgi:antibiotic biosynthesis monooxygenase (ABM) superfamily enzyme
MSQNRTIGLHSVRLFVIAWIGVYPMVTLVSWLFGEGLQMLPLLVRTLVLSGLVVAYMVFFWMPFIRRFQKS